jgi:cytoskeletal protein RodZ
MLLRSRHPVNRPAGTPPLESTFAEETVTAMEMVVAGKSYGTAMRLLREQHNMSYKELEQVTLIQPRYLEALENEDLDNLPPLVYVIAYIRTLCRFYKVSSDTSQVLVAKLKEQLEYSCNDELMNTLDVDRSGAAANERRLKNIMMVLTGGVLGVIVLVILLVVLFRSGCSAEESTEKKPAAVSSSSVDSKFNTNKIDKLLPAPDNGVPKLPLDK